MDKPSDTLLRVAAKARVLPTSVSTIEYQDYGFWGRACLLLCVHSNQYSGALTTAEGLMQLSPYHNVNWGGIIVV